MELNLNSFLVAFALNKLNIGNRYKHVKSIGNTLEQH